MSLITLDEAMVDWMTLTTFDEAVAEYWEKKRRFIERDAETARSKRVHSMQYSGEKTTTESGTISTLAGEQGGRVHYMIRMGGELCDRLVTVASTMLAEGTVNCTRIDLQVTTSEPSKWSQFSLFSDLQERGTLCSMMQSEDRQVGRMETVYIGSRSSQRYTRVYVKKTRGGGRLLRFEVEFKSKLAREVLVQLGGGRGRRRAILAHELKRKKHRGLEGVFRRCLGDDEMRVKVESVTDRDRTRDWLMRSVLPSLRRFVNSHEGDEGVREEFLKALAND